MAKRMMAMVLAMILLLGCVPARAAVLTKAEQYEAALEGLKSYLNDDEVMSISDLNESFNALGGYEHSIMLEMYTKVLLFIENGEFTPVQRLIGYMKDDSDFVAFVEENEAFGSLEALEWYAKGRQAEAEGRREDAADCYRMCSSFMDSAGRRRNLDEGRLEEMYQQGIVYYQMSTYDGYVQACSFFQMVEDEGGYEDSKAYLQKSLMYRDLFKPTPKPTVKPTAKPTAKPTPKPTPKPTATPVPRTFYVNTSVSHEKGVYTVSWVDSQNRAPYYVIWEPEGYTGARYGDDTNNKYYTTGWIVPGQRYTITVRDCDGKEVSAKVNIPAATAFRDGTLTQSKVDIQISPRYKEDANGSSSTAKYVKEFKAAEMKANMQNKGWSYGLFYRINLPTFAGERTYYEKVIFYTPDGAAYIWRVAYDDYTQKNNKTYWRWLIMGEDFFSTILKSRGQIPTGTYAVELYWDGMLVNRSNFKIR